MLTLYTAIGSLRFVNNGTGNSVPIVINSHREHGLSEHELLLWSCLAFQILQIHELESVYQTRLQGKGMSEGMGFSHYLNRLILRGLVAKGCGVSGVDSLYGLLGKLHIIPVRNSFRVRLFTCIRLLAEGKITCRECGRYLKKARNTPIENMVLELAEKVSLTTAELVTCVDRGRFPQKEKDVMSQLYEGSEESYETLADQAQFCHTQYPILQAVGNLYLNKQILFQCF